MELHVFPILMPPPASLSIQSLCVFPVHQARALVSCIQPGLVICFTIDNIHAVLSKHSTLAFSKWALLKNNQKEVKLNHSHHKRQWLQRICTSNKRTYRKYAEVFNQHKESSIRYKKIRESINITTVNK